MKLKYRNRKQFYLSFRQSKATRNLLCAITPSICKKECKHQTHIKHKTQTVNTSENPKIQSIYSKECKFQTHIKHKTQTVNTGSVEISCGRNNSGTILPLLVIEQLSSRQSVATRDLFFITTANILSTHTFLLLSLNTSENPKSQSIYR